MLTVTRRWAFAVLTTGTLALGAAPTTAHAQVSYPDLFFRRGGPPLMCLSQPLYEGFPDGSVIKSPLLDSCNPNVPLQQWYLVYRGHQPIAGHSGSYYLYSLVNVAAGKCLSTRNTSTGQPIETAGCNYSSSQNWATGNPNGSPNFGTAYFELIQQESGKCFTVDAFSYGAAPVLAPCTGTSTHLNNGQLWYPPNRWP